MQSTYIWGCHSRGNLVVVLKMIAYILSLVNKKPMPRLRGTMQISALTNLLIKYNS